MSVTWHALGVSFLLGVVYFIAAVPGGVALGLPAVVAGLAAWLGYSAIAAAMVLVGAPARDWAARRLGFRLSPDPSKIIWRVWKKWGVPGLALLAPVTIGPYIAVILALALGEPARRVLPWVALAAIPWAVLFVLASAFGAAALKG